MVNENGKSAAGTSDFDDACERYLLGELSETEREQFEEAYFADDGLFERYQAVKEELLDLYARGELPKEKQIRFAKHFSANESHRRQLNETKDFIQAITQVSAKTASQKGATLSVVSSITTHKSSRRQSFAEFFRLRPLVWKGAAAALLLIVIGGIWIVLRNRQQTTDSEIAVRPPISSPTTDQLANENSEAPMSANTIQSPRNEKNSIERNSEKQAAIRPSKSIAPNRARTNNNSSLAKSNGDPKGVPKKHKRKTDAATTAKMPVNERDATGFALTISTVGRDKDGKTETISLSPVTTRSINEKNALIIRPDTEFVRINLTFNHTFNRDEYSSYSAAITTVAGESVWQDTDVQGYVSDDEKIPLGWAHLGLASDVLKKQDYILTLYGHTSAGQKETIAEYYFRVDRSPTQNTTTPTPIPKP